jgi:hypothetical protein
MHTVSIEFHKRNRLISVNNEQKNSKVHSKNIWTVKIKIAVLGWLNH